jgi:hypothetical protein
MKLRFRITLAAVFFLTAPELLAQAKYGTEDDYKRLFYLNTQYIQSWVRSDTATYDRLLWANDFVHQNSSDGLLYPKNALMPRFGKPRFNDIEYFYPENVTIRFITPDAAMIFARTPFRAVGQSTESLSQYNDVYVRRDGRWICVSANVVSIVKPDDQRAGLTKVPAPVELISHHAGTVADIATLTELNEQHADAFVRSRPDQAEKILAEDYILLETNGLLYTKQQVIERIGEGGDHGLAAYTIENTTIQFAAMDVALVRALAVFKWKDGKASGVQYTDVYVKRNGGWVCVSGNNTPIRS